MCISVKHIVTIVYPSVSVLKVFNILLLPLSFALYSSLLFCSFLSISTVSVEHNKFETFGKGRKGDHLVHSPYNLEFLVDKENEFLCQKKLSKKEVIDFQTAVSRYYLFEMHYDDLPVRGFVGKVESNGSADPRQYKYYLYKHLHFTILYNKDQVIRIRAGTDPNDCVELTDDEDVLVDFLYSAKWNETDIAFEKRMEKYSRTYFEILSVICSCATVFLLTGFIVVILVQALKNDMAK